MYEDDNPHFVRNLLNNKVGELSTWMNLDGVSYDDYDQEVNNNVDGKGTVDNEIIVDELYDLLKDM